LVPRDARDFGAYQLLAKLATGGMAEIFLARPQGAARHDDVMVLKRILPHLAEDDHFVTMFRDEADLAAKLIHKNVCHVTEFGEFGGTWFIAMEYLHGVPLSRMMTRLSKAGKMLDFRVVAGIICQACEGLHAAHEARGGDGSLLGVVHRDVSPPNIMVCADGTVKLLDFGIAKARGANSRTRTGTVKGKNAYMSPEQILGKALDRRSDVFALAIVMYEMLAIKRLFHRESDFLTFKAITEEPIPEIRERRPDLPPGMRAALLQAMARDPNGRFDTALAFGNAIRNSVSTLGGPAAPADLARLLAQDFSDEMTARDEILKAADDPTLAPARTISAAPGYGGYSQSRPIPLPPPLPPAARSGELGASRAKPNTGPMQAVPSMILQSREIPLPSGTGPGTPGTGPGTPSQPIQMYGGAYGTQPSTRPPAGPYGAVPDLSATVPADTWMADPDTNLLRGHRMKSLRNGLIAIGVIAVLCIGVYFAVTIANNRSSDAPATGPGSALAAAPDAARAVTPPPQVPDIDAGIGPSHDDIVALSRYGFFSLAASANTTIYINNNKIGTTPLTRLPLSPGNYTVKAVGPHGKSKTFKISVYGGKDTDEGTINWDDIK
jgi:serine/threonine-protein kinase